MNIEDLPKGALPDPVDVRDYDFEQVLGGVEPQIDWEKGFRLSQPPDTDQASADCCVGEAWSKFNWQHKRKQFSVRSLFAYIALPSYGAYIRDGGLRLKNKGQEDIKESPDPNPKTPQNMRSKTDLNESDGLDDIAFDAYAISTPKIEYLAKAIQDYKGVVFGVNGTNNGWKNMLVPEPPSQGEPDIWGHALYGLGFHMHGDKKCIIAASSWCNTVKEHHLREHYFTSGNIFSPWVLIPRKENIVFKRVKKQDDVTFGVLIETPNGCQIIYATNEEQWRSWNKEDSYKLPTVNADGTTNWMVDHILPF